MLRALSLIIIVTLAAPCHQQSTSRSPCPDVFSYEPAGNEPGRWYGVINLRTNVKLYTVWLNIILDGKADLLGNWVGDVTTTDNMEFKITTGLQFEAGAIEPIRFFVQYNPLNKVPKVQGIRLNGKEVCNANDPSSAEFVFGAETTSKPNMDPVLLWRPDSAPKPESVTTRPRPQNSFSNSNDFPQPFTGVQDIDNVFIENNKKRQNECGKVNTVPYNPLIIDGNTAREGQWPWHVAIYQAKLFQTIDFKYHCGGTLVSDRHVITAAHCVTVRGSSQLLDKTTLSVFLGKQNLKNSVEGVQIRYVSSIIVHPDYNRMTLSRDIAIMKFYEPVSYTDRVRPACLWPEDQVDLRFVVGKEGSVVGWGVDKTGLGTEELMELTIPVVDQETCLRAYSEFYSRFTSSYTYCAGFIDQNKSACNGDSGGGMVFHHQGSWHLRGLVSVSVAKRNENRCDPNYYVVFTDVAKFLPWIKQNIA